MITLPNGHRFRFAAAAGALGFDGDDAGHGLVRLWKKPFRWLGKLDPYDFTIITKTVTAEPLVGRLTTLRPWRAVRLIPGGAVNSVGLTNGGFFDWVERHYPRAVARGYKLIASVQPSDRIQARSMARYLSEQCSRLVGVELNLSCPNVPYRLDYICETVRAFVRESWHPVLLKLGVADDIVRICTQLDGEVAAFDLINTVPWDLAPGMEGRASPLSRYGYRGAVSGSPIFDLGSEALKAVKAAGVKTPILSGGGIMSLADAKYRFSLGADAISFGTLFLRKPWEPNRIVRELVRSEVSV